MEIHVELATKTKMFDRGSADWFGKPPNTVVGPLALGLPGTLPVPNKKAIEWTILIGLALGCQINKISKFDRKHYFYPDLPKAYQISQYDMPFCKNGNYQLPGLAGRQAITNYKKKIINVTRVHLEEDTGKLIHDGDDTLVDFNRSGVPLVEIVTEPDFDNSDDVKQFLEELQILIRYLGISDADMEKGSMRLEPNISLRKVTSNKKQETNKSKLPITNFQLPKYKVEVKNINSFRFCQKAIEYEIKRQKELLEKGITPTQETRGWDENKQKTVSQRSKEQAHDYRYFPEPDIPPIELDDQFIANIKKMMPELPQQRINRYITEFGLNYQEAYIIVKNKKTNNYFEKVISELPPLNLPLNKGENEKGGYQSKIASLIINKKLSTNLSVNEFIEEFIKIRSPKQFDSDIVIEAIDKIIANNPDPVASYKSGKENAIMFLVGQVMKEIKGQGDAVKIRKLLETQLKTRVSS